ncbi:MAG: hypothetical protein LBS34_01655, partial [Rickettsiales bacterium]|nr:hypothetical protein [Rickettsiales bacterium]
MPSTPTEEETQRILNFSNGYYDLDQNKLFPHSPNKVLLNKINIEYGENISITKDNDWLNFLNSTFNNDQEKIRYLQKAMGYTFSGSAEENKMFLMHRDLSGRNTFIWSIIEAFEDYCNFYDS